MAYEVAREVTQPFHGPDGIEVLFQPGDQVPVDAELPDGVRSQLVVVEVPDPVPAPKAARSPKAPAAKPAADSAPAGAGTPGPADSGA
jgi:hypothetical protein